MIEYPILYFMIFVVGVCFGSLITGILYTIVGLLELYRDKLKKEAESKEART